MAASILNIYIQFFCNDFVRRMCYNMPVSNHNSVKSISLMKSGKTNLLEEALPDCLRPVIRHTTSSPQLPPQWILDAPLKKTKTFLPHICGGTEPTVRRFLEKAQPQDREASAGGDRGLRHSESEREPYRRDADAEIHDTDGDQGVAKSLRRQEHPGAAGAGDERQRFAALLQQYQRRAACCSASGCSTDPAGPAERRQPDQSAAARHGPDPLIRLIIIRNCKKPGASKNAPGFLGAFDN